MKLTWRDWFERRLAPCGGMHPTSQVRAFLGVRRLMISFRFRTLLMIQLSGPDQPADVGKANSGIPSYRIT